MNIHEDKFISIKKGLLELAVLKIISSNKVYAADILEKLGKTEFATKDGTLYPLLSRLKREGALNYEWAESEAGPPRKYYSLTDAGKKQLEALIKYWKDLDSTINNF
jgi:PadR family transcriptional regulator, regulatory protein PadR